MYRILLCLCLVACSPKAITPGPVYPESQRPEIEPLRNDPTEVAPGDDWSVSVEPGDTVIKPGLLVSEDLATKYINVYIDYPQLRVDFETDRSVFAAQRAVYESLVAQYRQKVSELQPSWWDRNKFFIGIGAGLFLGVTSAVILESR